MSRPAALALALCALATPALADPCEAPVSGYRAGQQIVGTVRYVGDGDSLCLGPTADPSTWVEIRLADFYAPELHDAGGRQAKLALETIAMGRQAICTVQRGHNGSTRSYDRVIASCRVGGVGVADAMRRVGVSEGGRGR